MRHIILFALTSALLSDALAAQSVNVDFGTDPAYAGAPAASYAGAAGQPGVWNSISTPSMTPTALVDLAGAPTTIAVAVTPAYPQDPVYTNDTLPDQLGVHAALLADWFELYGSSFTVTVSGLSDGWYDVFTYAALVDSSCSSTLVTVPGSLDSAQYVFMNEPYFTDLAPGVSHARHRVQVIGGSVSIVLTAIQGTCISNGSAACNGLQLVQLDGSYAGVCSGDGSGTVCPCGNAGAPGRGCANSFEPLGAQLTGSGVASVSSDSLVLTGVGVSNSFVTFFQGTQVVQGGYGKVFGDGLRCAGGSILRLGLKLGSGNQVSYPGALDASISVRGAIPSSGATRVYQTWYRNAAAFCSASTFNLSNALRVEWMP